MHRVGVVIPAGGQGVRFGGKAPKQFLSLQGKTILHRSIALFESIRAVQEIVVVVPTRYVKKVRGMVNRSDFGKASRIVSGGPKRQDSVWNGLNAFSTRPDIVLVHDAVRPLVSRQVVEDVIRQAIRYRAAVVGVRIKDTVKVEGKKGFYTQTLDRENLWAVQTPQGFDYALLTRAHRAVRKARYVGTDEAALVERLGIPVRIVPGDERNIKITTKKDLELAKLLLK